MQYTLGSNMSDFANASPLTPDYLATRWGAKELERTWLVAEFKTPHNRWTHETALVMVEFDAKKNPPCIVYFMGHWIDVPTIGRFEALMYGVGLSPKQ